MEPIIPRLEALRNFGSRFADQVERLLPESGDPAQALTGLERWLLSTPNPETYAEQFAHMPDRLKLLLLLLGTSQPQADVLIQNPEFGSLFLEQAEISKRAAPADLVEEGLRLLQFAAGTQHAMDRLRYLKQKWNFSVLLNDLEGVWTQEEAWRGLSDLADAIVELTLLTTWKTFSQGRDLPANPPISVAAFGKLGARELNYSSDIDIVYVLDEDANERLERECTRFCEVLGRALSERMGRGALFRVDLRLRPFGSQGPILSRFKSFENYFRRYAEAWEVQALIKSRVIFGDRLRPLWTEMKWHRAFSSTMSDASLAELLKGRVRIEEHSAEADLKRGPGGIRDVEFLCQTLQLIYGRENPDLRSPATCDALRALAEMHLIDKGLVAVLLEGYTFLRKLEHRVQLLGDRQTHEIPLQPVLREKLRVLMGFESFDQLISVLRVHRKSIRSIYNSRLRLEPYSAEAREELAKRFGDEASSFLQWFDALPESESYYRSIENDQKAISRISTLLRFAPQLIGRFKSNLALTDSLISDEIRLMTPNEERFRHLSLSGSERSVADAYANSVAAAEAEWTLNEAWDLGGQLQKAGDELLNYCARRFSISFEIIALGSYGCGEQSACSDLDVLFLCEGQQGEAERQAQAMLGFLLQLKRFGLVPAIDLRLRPDGRKGLLVRSYEGFSSYSSGDMETWERFALGNARLVHGTAASLNLVRRAAYKTSLDRAMLAELQAMKARVEGERLKPQHMFRDIKLGFGGLNDLEWAVHLLELSTPEIMIFQPGAHLVSRMKNLARAGLINTFEAESLLKAREHLLYLRNRICLLDYPQDLVPENPNRLLRLAQSFGFSEGNDLLRHHEPIVGWVRNYLADTSARLAQATQA